jgi:hypothetical protein
MSILFYDHLIDKTEIKAKLDELNLPEDKRSKFKTMIDEILHAGILEYILQKLHPHNHATFLSQLERAPYDPELIRYLKQYADEKIEEGIEKESERIIKLVLRDLRKAQVTN